MPNPYPNQRDQFVLTTLPSKARPPPSRSKDSVHDRKVDLDVDLDPDSDAALLRQHLKDNEEQEVDDNHNNHDPDIDQAGSGLLQALRAIMSLEPLLSRSISTRETGSYGIANETFESEQAGGKTGKSSALGTMSASEGSQSRRHRQENAPIIRDKIRVQGSKSTRSDGRRRSGTARRHLSNSYSSSDDEYPSSGDEAIDVDGNHPRWTDANPPDDSP